eukprot:CAMPEP_0174328556 /NCGR_PEP_ID=MMETSP0810-20121108/15217_1 /TAXON_ID=73025 ORGANISM="Eutreptiella gymnastica-like, Strain CCMP1594" /NCGR_SAMPLE_ID=MMETSP0810 /ASSEMBLY_ACC=CAM_ASM_000659 /LENGTH=58 /DNA_ID=CAMNT_0015442685 /DNA_START=86 /DNA_END=262 /DNA_ORIENTATION=-
MTLPPKPANLNYNAYFWSPFLEPIESGKQIGFIGGIRSGIRGEGWALEMHENAAPRET